MINLESQFIMLGVPDTPPERAVSVRVLGTAVRPTVSRLHRLVQGQEHLLGLLRVGPARDGGLGEGPACRQAPSSHYRLSGTPLPLGLLVDLAQELGCTLLVLRGLGVRSPHLLGRTDHL